MVYKNGFIVAVKNSAGKVLRDTGNKVCIPFYEEYSLLLKNENSRKCLATVIIDGEDIAKGKRFIINANDKFDIERFVAELNEGRKFQFVPENDSRIEDKKDSGELGYIEVVFTLEKEKKILSYGCFGGGYIPTRPPMRYSGDTINYSCSSADSFSMGKTFSMSKAGGQSCTRGGTAKGSRSTQKFTHGDIGTLEDNSTTIRLKLVPIDNEDKEQATVQKTKRKHCIKCGAGNPFEAHYCMECGKEIPNARCPVCKKLYYSHNADNFLGIDESLYCSKKCGKADGLTDEELECD